MSLIATTTYQTLELCYPSALAEDSTLRATFTLNTKDGRGIAVTLGGLFKGKNYIGSFAGFQGFVHDVKGADKEAVEALLEALSQELNESYSIPLPEVPEEMSEPAEEEGENNG